MKKSLLLIAICFVFGACGWFREKPQIAEALAKHFDNSLYKKFDTAAYNPVFKQKLQELRPTLSNPKTTTAFYVAHQNDPLLISRFYVNGGLDSLTSYIARSSADGFNPEVFNLTELKKLITTLDANKFQKIEEVYPLIAALEIKAADALLRYVSATKYGVINPRKIYNRYYINNHRPDSLGMDSLLNTTNIVLSMRLAQPSSKSYLELKKMLLVYRDSIKNETDPAIRTIKLNLERLRWRLPVAGDEFVVVNIPDFSLTWFNKNDTLAHMNVCVGAKRESTYTEKMSAFLQSGNLDDKPKNHETPQLVSTFNSIQVNPIWNIPVSIAQSEIYWMARKDPYYLSNSNIKVYFKGKPVDDPDTIQWSKYAREKLPFTFKQGSGDGNALGKFKFIFNNSSSIYLHDTNNKYGFKLTNRAISHGCVRIENPLRFAELMVKNKYQYDDLRMEVNLPPVDTMRNDRYKKILAKKLDTNKVFRLKPSWFATRKNVAVVISYYTAWAENGQVQFRPDVYEYDGTLWNAIKKFM